MFDKVKIFLTILYLSGVSMQYPSCRQYDFNDVDSVLSFESCLQGPQFIIKSYADVSFKPFRKDDIYFLSNIRGAATSCFRTKQIFNLNNYTELFSMIYMNSEVENDNSHVMLLAIDDLDNDAHLLGDLIGRNGWKEYHTYGNFPAKKVKIELRAYLSPNAMLGIEYFHIVNPSKAEVNCRRLITTTKTTATTAVTTAKTDLTPTVTQSTSSQTQPIATQTQSTPRPMHTEPSTTETDPSPTMEQTTNKETELSPTSEETTYTEIEPSPTKQTTASHTPCVKRVPSNINIYNFISFFNFTSKIIN